MKLVILLLISMLATVAQAQSEEQLQRIGSLAWKIEAGKYKVSKGDASITTSEYDRLVEGADAAEFLKITQGVNIYNPDAVIYRIDGPEADSQVIYTFNGVGFVKTDDWEENINKDEMLKDIKANTEESNKHRDSNNQKLFVDRWRQEPYLDREQNIIYWAIAGHDESNNQFINAKSLKLGRKGYTEIMWVGSPDQFSSSEAVLKPVLANYSYHEGFQYDDYIPGKDIVAAAGAGALVYKLITGKVAAKAGVGILALIAIFAKKLWFIVFLPFMYAWNWIKSKFSKTS
jgi:uncharacterized membrane-anchored protein